MSAITDTKGIPGDWLVAEAANLYSREEVTFLAGSGAERELKSGMVVGKITASGKYVQFDDTAATGQEDAAGVLLFDLTVPDGADKKGVILVRHAQVRTNGLVWPATADAGEQAAAIVQLEALGFVMRRGDA